VKQLEQTFTERTLLNKTSTNSEDLRINEHNILYIVRFNKREVIVVINHNFKAGKRSFFASIASPPIEEILPQIKKKCPLH
jgi:hypothetical protein